MRKTGDPRYDPPTSREHALRRLREAAQTDRHWGGRPEEVAGAWDAALAADRPVVLAVLTDPNVLPLPAHIAFDEAKGVLEALKRDPNERSVIIEGVCSIGRTLR